MKNLHKPRFSLSAFLLTVFVVSFLALLFSGEAFAQGKKGPKAPAPLPKTGQTISYAIGDDGDLQTGVPWPVPRFIDHGDGTVTDKLTGLMWTKNTQIIPSRKTWYDALAACNNLELAGYTDWRLPNVNEQVSLLDWSISDYTMPRLPQGHPFIGLLYIDNFWTSTTRAEFIEHALYVNIRSGRVLPETKTYDLGEWVWPVREGTRKNNED
jgi:hypothetical protein